eukprot:EG_transcript_18104
MPCCENTALRCKTAYRFALAGVSFTCVTVYMAAYIFTETKKYTFARPLHYQSIVTIVLCTLVNAGFTYISFTFPRKMVVKLVVLLLLGSLVTGGGSLSMAGAEWAECVPDDAAANATNANSTSVSAGTVAAIQGRGMHHRGLLGDAVPKVHYRQFRPLALLDYSHPSCFLASLQCLTMVFYCLTATLQLFSIWSLKPKRAGPYNRISEPVPPEPPAPGAAASAAAPAQPPEPLARADTSSTNVLSPQTKPAGKFAYR